MQKKIETIKHYEAFEVYLASQVIKFDSFLKFNFPKARQTDNTLYYYFMVSFANLMTGLR